MFHVTAVSTAVTILVAPFFIAVAALLYAFAVRRLLGLRLGGLRTLIAGDLAWRRSHRQLANETRARTGRCYVCGLEGIDQLGGIPLRGRYSYCPVPRGLHSSISE